ncbi:Uncharacterized protein BM_BM17169 [Brugia malayi]|uniref:Gag protein n=1 Tax=Brugia malayi TaxID=6279 RepID=A0A4E9G0J0_BRUMA|nr:Uncharacterized protein BM_BM17169 [Brugia malayi]VIP00225.1 Uncharacterized protein BM_BM17169 [Brugia malayi]
MSSHIIASFQPAKERLVSLLKEVNQLEIKSPEPRKALQAISGYDIAPENYEVIRKLLNEKYGDYSIVTTLLYNELQSIEQNEREWIGTIENIERVLRQLEALGESLEHSNIEILIESKLPLWILNKIYKHKKKALVNSQTKKLFNKFS